VALREQLLGAAVLDEDLRRSKHSGLSDRQIAALRPELAGGPASARCARGWHPPGVQDRRHLRGRVRGPTPYHYSSYELDPAAETEVAPQTEKPKVLILGSGPNRIGQGIEFDYSCVHAATTLSQAGSRPSWSTATRRRCPPTTTPPTGSTSSR
jgi:carbamoyl-phosphate synthase large subunit